MKYKKNIEMFFTGMVIAIVIKEDGTSGGSKDFHNRLFESDESVMKRAHQWADSRVALLEKYESNQQNIMKEKTLREEFEEKFPNLKWETTGGTGDIVDFTLAKISQVLKEAEGIMIEEIVIAQKEGTPTSRLTSYNARLQSLQKKYLPDNQ